MDITKTQLLNSQLAQYIQNLTHPRFEVRSYARQELYYLTNKKRFCMSHKELIFKYILNANFNNTILGMTTKSYADSIEHKTAHELYEFIKMVKDFAIKYKNDVEDLFGTEGTEFFATYQLPTDFAPTFSEGAE